MSLPACNSIQGSTGKITNTMDRFYSCLFYHLPIFMHSRGYDMCHQEGIVISPPPFNILSMCNSVCVCMHADVCILQVFICMGRWL